MGNHVHKLLKVRYTPLTFIGHNNNNQLLQPKSIEVLLSGLTAVSNHSNMAQPTKEVVDKFQKTFMLFSKCHNAYNGSVVDDKVIDQLGKCMVLIGMKL